MGIRKGRPNLDRPFLFDSPEVSRGGGFGGYALFRGLPQGSLYAVYLDRPQKQRQSDPEQDARDRKLQVAAEGVRRVQ